MIHQMLNHPLANARVAEAAAVVVWHCKDSPLFDPQLARMCALLCATDQEMTAKWAARHGHLELMQELSASTLDGELFGQAILGGHLHIVQYFESHGMPIMSGDVEKIVRSGHVHILRHYVAKGGIVNDHVPSWAASAGHLDMLKYLLEELDLHHSWGALSNAAYCGHIEIARYLIDFGVNVQVRQNDAIWRAASVGNISMVQLLLDAGAKVDSKKFPPIAQAALHGRLEMVQFLCPMSTATQLSGALTKAAKRGHASIVDHLLPFCAHDGDYVWEAMDGAISGGHLSVIQSIEQHGAPGWNPENWKNGALSINAAIQNGHSAVVRHAIDSGATICHNNLMAAAKSLDIELAKYVIDIAIEAYTLYKETQQYAVAHGLHRSLQYVKCEFDDPKCFRDIVPEAVAMGNLETVRHIIENIDANELKLDYDAMLTIAAKHRSIEMVDYFASLGANAMGHALRLAINEDSSLELVIKLVRLGANVMENDNEALITSITAAYDDDVMEYLIHSGADVHARDDEALMLAVQNEYASTAELLIQLGADVHARNNSALQLAIGTGNENIVRLLIDSGADVHVGREQPLRFAVERANMELIECIVAAGATITREVLHAAAASDSAEVREWGRRMA